MSLHPSEPGRRRACDRAEGKLGVSNIQRREHLREGGTKVAKSHLGRCGQRCAEQDDAEIGVGADQCQCRFDGVANAVADPRSGEGERRRCHLGAPDELRGGHAVARGEDMDVAGLRRLELIKTSRPEGGGNLFRQRGHAVAPRSVRAASASTRSPARIRAMLARVTFCRPDQAGMLLTSSTVGRPSGS